MKYTLQMNALSSLSIAIEKFKKVYYYNGTDQESIYDENMKMCAIFLENSVELLLKSILVNHDPLSIYKEPNSRKIKEALSKVDENHTLEDILITSGNFKTITYTDSVKAIHADICKSDKVKNILEELGYIRNAITHFGIVGKNEEYIISFINTFDVIYNYLFPEIIEIDEISDFVVSDDLFVNTIHGYKPLYDENFIYNNIVDFLDELIESSSNSCFQYRIKNSKYNISKFISLYNQLMNSNDFKKMFEIYNAFFDFDYFNTDNLRNNSINIGDKENGIFDYLLVEYLPYNNLTYFVGECGYIYFIIEHSENKILIYSDAIIKPSCDEQEFEKFQLREHINNGICTEYKLSKKNLQLAFENILKMMKSETENTN